MLVSVLVLIPMKYRVSHDILSRNIFDKKPGSLRVHIENYWIFRLGSAYGYVVHGALQL